MSRDGPSAHGKILGAVLADWARKGMSEGQQDMCSGCAFREGTLANMSGATGKEALNCALGIEDAPFGCHHGMKDGTPTRACQGWIAAQRFLEHYWPGETLAKLAEDISACKDKPDEVRAAYERWVAKHDPEGRLNDYQRSRIFNRALCD